MTTNTVSTGRGTDTAFEFRPGVREELLPSIRRSEIEQLVRNAVSDLIGQRIGGVREFIALMFDPKGKERLAVADSYAQFFAEITLPALRQMGYDFDGGDEPVEPPTPQIIHQNFTEDLGNGIKLEMIAIPGGSFLMGSEDFGNTKPVHKVMLSPFHIGKFQVTQAQWRAVMKTNPSHFKGDTLPVETVSWEDAKDFCRKLSGKTGNEYRLPTEAEWEYACLAGSTGKYCFGDDEALLKDYAWYYENSGSKTHPVGKKKPNNWGLHDMHGNVLEWCQDWYDKNYYAELSKKGEAVNPQGPANGEYRVLRGGSWLYDRDYARAVYRYRNHPALRGSVIGFRVVCCRPPSSS